MNKFISLLFLIFAGCSSSVDYMTYRISVMPAVGNKFNTIGRACISDTNKGSLNIQFNTDKEIENFCKCLVWGFGGVTKFEPVNERYIKSVEDGLYYYNDQYLINFVESLQKNYLDLVITIQNLNEHHSWKKHYDVLYRNNVNYCTRNANYGLSI